MAVFRPAAPFGDLRGSIGQTTYGRNGAGLFARARTAPDDSAPSAEQLAQRQMLRDVATAWLAISAAQRTAWRALAASTSMPNALGDPYTPTAWQLYTRLQLFLLFLGLAITADVPLQAIAPTSNFEFDYLGGAGKRIRLLSIGQAAWSGYILFQKAYPLSLNRYWCRGPWNTGKDLVVDHTWYDTLPKTVVATDQITDNKAYFIRYRILDETTGGISCPIIHRVTSTT